MTTATKPESPLQVAYLSAVNAHAQARMAHAEGNCPAELLLATAKAEDDARVAYLGCPPFIGPPQCPGKGTDGGECYGVAQHCPSHPDHDEPLPDGGYIEHRTVRSEDGGYKMIHYRHLPNGKLAGRRIGSQNGLR